jgi:hypothetical protein
MRTFQVAKEGISFGSVVFLWICFSGFTFSQAKAPAEVRNQTIESISGVWEEGDDATAVAFDIAVKTSTPRAAARGGDLLRSIHTAQIYVFRASDTGRSDAGGETINIELPLLNRNPPQIEVNIPASPRTSATSINLVFNPHKEQWTGHLLWQKFERDVVLRRPNSKRSANNPFLGTWTRGGMMENCVHIAEFNDSSLVAWSDDLYFADRVRYAKGMSPSNQIVENFGNLVAASSPSKHRLELGFRANSAGCCSTRYVGTLSPDGRTISNPSDVTAPLAAFSGAWERVNGNSCRNVPRNGARR